MNTEQIIKMPDMGDFNDVEVIDIAVKQGDTIAVGDVLLTVESDKASMDIPADISGEISKILLEVGDRASMGDNLFRVLIESVSADSIENSLTETEKSAVAEKSVVNNTAMAAPNSIKESEVKQAQNYSINAE